MSTPADLSRPLPTAAEEAREEKLVESKGVEPLPESTPAAGGAGEPAGAEGAPSAPAPAKLFAWLRDLRRDQAMVLQDSRGVWLQAVPVERLGWVENAARELVDRVERVELERDHLQSRADDTDGRIAAMEIHGNSADHWYRKATAYKDAFQVRDEAVKRAEKAEAERDLAKGQLTLAIERSERQSTLIRSVTQASGCHMPSDVPDSIRSLRARAEKAEAELAGMKTHARKVGAKMAADAAAEANAKWRHETGIAIGKDRARVAAIEVSAPPPAERLMAELSSVDCSPQLFDLLAGIIGELGR